MDGVRAADYLRDGGSSDAPVAVRSRPQAAAGAAAARLPKETLPRPLRRHAQEARPTRRLVVVVVAVARVVGVVGGGARASATTPRTATAVAFQIGTSRRRRAPCRAHARWLRGRVRPDLLAGVASRFVTAVRDRGRDRAVTPRSRSRFVTAGRDRAVTPRAALAGAVPGAGAGIGPSAESSAECDA